MSVTDDAGVQRSQAATAGESQRGLSRRGRQHEFGLAAGQPRLRRSHDDRMLTGLCGGVASFTGFDVSAIRLAFVLTAIVSLGVVAAAYLLLSAIIPAAPTN